LILPFFIYGRQCVNKEQRLIVDLGSMDEVLQKKCVLIILVDLKIEKMKAHHLSVAIRQSIRSAYVLQSSSPLKMEDGG
jgi:phosphoribosylpyrophosphate synthetase